MCIVTFRRFVVSALPGCFGVHKASGFASLRERLVKLHGVGPQKTLSQTAVSTWTVVLANGLVENPAVRALNRVLTEPTAEGAKRKPPAARSDLQFLLQPSCFRVSLKELGGKRGGVVSLETEMFPWPTLLNSGCR